MIEKATGSRDRAALMPSGWLDRQLAALRRYTRLQLDITNERVAHPGPAMIIG